MENKDLKPCELGTLDYWQNRYDQEIVNFRDHGDTGEVWFGESILEKVVRWIDRSPLISKSSNIIDIGCGNGLLLVELARRGFLNLTGVDYSEKAIILAREVTEKFNLSGINYIVCDILQPTFQNSFDVAVDKGTYDAISLNENTENRKKYVSNVCNILRANGLLIMTSCNWTKEELDQQFTEAFYSHQIIPTPQFQFGGNIGNVVTCVIYRKK